MSIQSRAGRDDDDDDDDDDDHVGGTAMVSTLMSYFNGNAYLLIGPRCNVKIIHWNIMKSKMWKDRAKKKQVMIVVSWYELWGVLVRPPDLRVPTWKRTKRVFCVLSQKKLITFRARRPWPPLASLLVHQGH